ncbi:MAG: DUF6702 family protein [Ferruginibacter sp.]
MYYKIARRTLQPSGFWSIFTAYMNTLSFFQAILLSVCSLWGPVTAVHPYYVTVTDIEYNRTTKALEISIRFFTNDIESVLKKKHPQKRIDLLTRGDKEPMEQLLDAYVREHVKLQAETSPVGLNYVGYESKDDCIYAYYEAPLDREPTSLTVTNNLLFEYKKEQISIIHYTIGKKRQSVRLNNPDDTVTFKR